MLNKMIFPCLQMNQIRIKKLEIRTSLANIALLRIYPFAQINKDNFIMPIDSIYQYFFSPVLIFLCISGIYYFYLPKKEIYHVSMHTEYAIQFASYLVFLKFGNIHCIKFIAHIFQYCQEINFLLFVKKLLCVFYKSAIELNILMQRR